MRRCLATSAVRRVDSTSRRAGHRNSVDQWPRPSRPEHQPVIPTARPQVPPQARRGQRTRRQCRSEPCPPNGHKREEVGRLRPPSVACDRPVAGSAVTARCLPCRPPRPRDMVPPGTPERDGAGRDRGRGPGRRWRASGPRPFSPSRATVVQFPTRSAPDGAGRQSCHAGTIVSEGAAAPGTRQRAAHPRRGFHLEVRAIRELDGDGRDGVMITGELKSKVDRIWNTMWSGGISNPLSVIEQLTYLLFIKGLDERTRARSTRPPAPVPFLAAWLAMRSSVMSILLRVKVPERPAHPDDRSLPAHRAASRAAAGHRDGRGRLAGVLDATADSPASGKAAGFGHEKCRFQPCGTRRPKQSRHRAGSTGVDRA